MKKQRLALASVLCAVILSLLIYVLTQLKLFLYLLFAFMLVYVVVSFFFTKCPSCGRVLGKYVFTKKCPYCEKGWNEIGDKH